MRRFLLSFIGLLLTFLLAAALTGRSERAYKVLPPDSVITVSGETTQVVVLAEQFVPRIFLREKTFSPPLMWVWYEAVPTDTTIDIVYHFAWQNEHNPNQILDILYSAYRAAYFGFPLYDIEYFQVSVSRVGGLIQQVRFETSGNEDYSQTFPKHFMVNATLKERNKYEIRRTNNSGLPLDTALQNLRLIGKRFCVGLQTWNHAFVLLDSTKLEYRIPQNAPIKFLTDADYARYKFARRSQGDYQTRENKLMLGVSWAAILAFIILTWNVRKNRGKIKRTMAS